MKRAVIGVPSKCSTRTSLAGSMPSSLTSSVCICPSRFCSTTNTFSCAAMNSGTESGKGKARSRIASSITPSCASTSSASCMAGLVEPK